MSVKVYRKNIYFIFDISGKHNRIPSDFPDNWPANPLILTSTVNKIYCYK